MICKLQVYILYNIEIYIYKVVVILVKNNKKLKTIYIEDLVHHVGR